MTEPRYLIDTYLDFVRAEGIPIAEGFGLDLLALETQPWPRMGPVSGSYALTSGRGDFIDMYVLDIPPARATDPQKHLYEEVIYVLDGRGSTSIEAADGSRHSFGTQSRRVLAVSTQSSCLIASQISSASRPVVIGDASQSRRASSCQRARAAVCRELSSARRAATCS